MFSIIKPLIDRAYILRGENIHPLARRLNLKRGVHQGFLIFLRPGEYAREDGLK